VSRLSRQCGILNLSQPYRPPRPVTGVVLLTKRNYYYAVLHKAPRHGGVWGSGGIGPCTLNRSIFKPPRKDSQVPAGDSDGWVSQSVWEMYRNETSLTLAVNRTQVVQPLAYRLYSQNTPQQTFFAPPSKEAIPPVKILP
jgi:hypothetical protein